VLVVKVLAEAFILMLLFSVIFVLRFIDLAAATPSISILSPSGIYTTPGVNDTAMDIPLIFAVNETVSLMKYSLVGSGYGKDSPPFTGNTTIHHVPLGVYLLTVYVYGTDIHAVSHFHVENPYLTITPTPSPTSNPSSSPSSSPQEPEPFPTALVTVASVVIVVLLVAGLLVFFKKRHH